LVKKMRLRREKRTERVCVRVRKGENKKSAGLTDIFKPGRV